MLDAYGKYDTEEKIMSTFMQKNETVARKWYVVDAADKPIGKTAVAVADLLRGKNDPTFTPNVRCSAGTSEPDGLHGVRQLRLHLPR